MATRLAIISHLGVLSLISQQTELIVYQPKLINYAHVVSKCEEQDT